ncbi:MULTISPECIES: Lrp/AsnC family transcriptional regulator [unclassified Actinopolyspora]|uniref:Lrp/AsnC family transcriptional regulator n=1 Tax=unclassified Actinopolyspora TaxID=2639451 RepID=UPI0013F693EE|nr:MULTISPECIES: Lrp/AsnC family transcriptional regulator [unclassified Actinopolyspora]NHD17057.1 Lrp/AsnC family transcriptional regulator [Actinopolyspora sp. BKK2]NHE76209.1 Lrp/AsnC family transcriptional regulator [Actinopolyspora sp. BKK1]
MTNTVELDSVDWRILEELQNDATLPNRTLAERIGLAASSCLQRVRRLREQGVITGSHIDVDPAATGLTLEAVVSINVRPHTRAVVDSFREFVMAQPETRSLLHVSGQADFMLHVAVADSAHLQSFLVDKLSARTEVRHFTTSVVLEQVHTRALTPPRPPRPARRRS